MEDAPLIARNETRPIDADTLQIVIDHLGNIALGKVDFSPIDTTGVSDLEMARQTGYNQGVTEVMDEVKQMLQDLIDASTDQ